jgi:hypothetical protein
MGLGQTMLTAGLLVLMIMITISANRMLMESSMTAYEAESINIAADLANSLIMEATKKRFDEYQGSYNLASLTTATSFGPEAGEALSVTPDVAPFQSVLKFDDVDDYHGYTRIVDGQSMKGFKITAQVSYVMLSSQQIQNTTTKTALKRLDVKVEHSTYIPAGFTITRIVTY